MCSVLEFPGFDRLYRLDDPLNYNWLQAECDDAGSLELQDALVRSRAQPPDPVTFRWTEGKARPADFVWSVGMPLVSERVVDLLLGERFTGWSSYAARLLGRDGEEIGGYHGLGVWGRCGEIDDDRCDAYLEEFPGGPDIVFRGMYFEPETWDGADIFMPEGEHYWWIFVTERVCLALQGAKIRNASLTRLDCVERPGLDIGMP
jgi:hypothetical protein